MAAALYDPEHGYYTRNIRTVGSGGDFSTTATLSPLLGRALAAWMRHEWRERPGLAKGGRSVIEVGPGNGALMEAVRSEFSWWERYRIGWHLVEKSPTLKAHQRERLGSSVFWHDEVADALEKCRGSALIYSNELVDAFPVTLVEWREGVWQEVWLEITDRGGLAETLRPLREMDSSLLEWEPAIEGQRAEIHDEYRQWLARWQEKAQVASLLTIDYGGELPGLYLRRPGGSLRGYFMHQRRLGLEVLSNMGWQDLTADVNFTDLQRWSEAAQWRTTALMSQRDFLLKWGGASSHRPEVQQLMDSEGAGGAFQVLVQRRG